MNFHGQFTSQNLHGKVYKTIHSLDTVYYAYTMKANDNLA